MLSFARKGDFLRHVQTHLPTRRLFPCPIAGCRRVGERGLPKADKLVEHMREVHGIVSDRGKSDTRVGV